MKPGLVQYYCVAQAGLNLLVILLLQPFRCCYFTLNYSQEEHPALCFPLYSPSFLSVNKKFPTAFGDIASKFVCFGVRIGILTTLTGFSFISTV